MKAKSQKKVFLIKDNSQKLEAVSGKLNFSEDIFELSFKKVFSEKIKEKKEREIAFFLEKNFSFLKNLDYLIFALDKSLLYSFSFKITFFRKNPLLAIQRPELENLLLKAKQKIFDLWQKEAKNSLAIPSLKLKLCWHFCDKVLINDHLVTNPLGFRAKTISFLIKSTFISKNFFDLLKPTLEKIFKISPNINLIFIEKNFCFLNSLEKFFKEKFLYFGAWKEGLEASILGDEVFKKELISIKWSFSEKAIEKISETFSLQKETAQKIYEFYLNHQVSLRFKKILNQELETIILGFYDASKFLFSALNLKKNHFKNLLILGDDLFFQKIKKINLGEINSFSHQNLKKLVLDITDTLRKLKIKVKSKKDLNHSDFLTIIYLNYPLLEKNELVTEILSHLKYQT